MIRQQHGQIVTYEFESLRAQPAVIHAVFARHGGVSPAPWHSLNLSASTGDLPQHVDENHRRMFDVLGYSAADAVTTRQVHSATVAVVDREQRGKRIPASDGLVTRSRGVVLVQRHADCPPLFLYDPHLRVVAIAHAGWRGTLANIAGSLVQQMCVAFGSEPSSLVAAIGPGIGACCYHVGADVQRAFVKRHADGARWLHRRNGSTYLDLSDANYSQLADAGVREIEVAGICTACNVAEFYSARAENRLNGCFGAVIALRGS